MLPRAPHSPAHFDFTDTAYTKCLRCASKSATPRRPASGSVLSLANSLSTCHRLRPREFLGCLHPVPSPWTLAFDPSRGSRHFRYPHTPILVRETISGLHYRSLSLRPVDLLAHLSELTRSSPSRRGLLLPGFSTDWSPAPPPDITTGATGQVPLAGLSPARTPTSFAAARRYLCQSFPGCLSH